MRFIDNTGHIFSMKSFEDFPLGYEYEQTPYIFWIDGEYSQKLSVNNYYILPVRVLVKQIDHNDVVQPVKIRVNVTSDVFKIYCPDGEFGDKDIELSELVSDIVYDEQLGKTPLNVIRDLKPMGYAALFDAYTFYVVAKSKEEGTWSTNILIEVDTFKIIGDNVLLDYTDYCPITVAGTFVDEIEQLKINSQNIGVNLPKDIIKAVYQYQHGSDITDEVAYNTKLKEYLINHMLLKSECGNYNAVLKAIDWFGWKQHIDITKLFRTDNEFVEQFIHDSFNIEDDIIECFKKFKSSSYISLFVNENKELDSIYKLNFTDDFWGEGKPEFENLFDKTVNVEKYGINFIKQYYDYTFNEMAVKLSCLAYMLKKYFLPVHLSIKNSSIRHQVFANDIKLLNKCYVVKTEVPIYASIDLYNTKTNVSFEDLSNYYLHTQYNILVDSNLNKFTHYTDEFCSNSQETFLNTTNCFSVSIPIKFSSSSDAETSIDNNVVYNCGIILEQINEDTNKYIYTSNFSFTQSEASKYESFVLIPQQILAKTSVSEWENKQYVLHVHCNGIWYKKEFVLRVPDLQVTINRLQYNYESLKFKQIRSIQNNTPEFICDMYVEDLVTTNNAHFTDEYIRAYNLDKMLPKNADNLDDFTKWITPSINYYINKLTERIKITNNKKYYNRIHIYDISIKSFKADNIDKLTYNPDDLSIYNDFFGNDGIQKYNLSNGTKQLRYDFYLMRDKNNKYYAVFISQDTINTQDLVAEREVIVECPEDGNYNFHKLKSDEVFLINRMLLTNDDGNHKFNADDIISLEINNIDLPFILSLGSKWTIKNISIGNAYIDEVSSKTNTAIVSIPENQSKYAKGYYDITVSYTLDRYNKNERTLTQRICIQ